MAGKIPLQPAAGTTAVIQRALSKCQIIESRRNRDDMTYILINKFWEFFPDLLSRWCLIVVLSQRKAMRGQCLNRIHLLIFRKDWQWCLYARQSTNFLEIALIGAGMTRDYWRVKYQVRQRQWSTPVKFKGCHILGQTVPSKLPSCLSNQGSVLHPPHI